ncbi:MAG: hypothetical protein ABS92_12855 [Thiobacillus sp. SCN 63-374]|nr:MAG: hypothetical protein ABS92_12855 [Thiobacillus sp. SCN 63-374]
MAALLRLAPAASWSPVCKARSAPSGRRSRTCPVTATTVAGAGACRSQASGMRKALPGTRR